MDGTRLTRVATGWHTRRRTHRYKCRTMGRERGLFRGCVKKFNRRMRSDALVMHPSGASRPICQIEADGGTKETRGFPGTEARCPSSSNYQAFIPWKRPPFLPPSDTVSDWPFCLPRSNQKSSVELPDTEFPRRSKKSSLLVLVLSCVGRFAEQFPRRSKTFGLLVHHTA